MAMGDANAGVPRGKVFHGARAYLVIDGATIGYCQGVSGQESVEQQPVDVLDNLEVEEFVPVGYTVTGTIRFVRIVGRSLKEAGIFTPVGNLLTAGDLTMVIKDRPEDEAIYTFEGVKCTTLGFDASKRAIGIENVSFVAKRMRDESGLV